MGSRRVPESQRKHRYASRDHLTPEQRRMAVSAIEALRKEMPDSEINERLGRGKSWVRSVMKRRPPGEMWKSTYEELMALFDEVTAPPVPDAGLKEAVESMQSNGSKAPENEPEATMPTQQTHPFQTVEDALQQLSEAVSTAVVAQATATEETMKLPKFVQSSVLIQLDTIAGGLKKACRSLATLGYIEIDQEDEDD